MSFITNLSVRMKLILLSIPSLVAFLVFSSIILIDNKNHMSSANEIHILVDLAAAGSAAVHELQKERGASAGYLSSRGAKFGDTLTDQYKQTDAAVSAWFSLWNEYKPSVNDPGVLKSFNQVTNDLQSRLASTRRQVQGLSADLKPTIAYYTNMNGTFIGVVPLIAGISEYSGLTGQLAMLYNFLSAKEQAGIEGAVLSSTFSAGKFNTGVYVRFIALMTAQQNYLDTFSRSAKKDQVDFFNSSMNDPSIKQVEEFRDAAMQLYLDNTNSVDANSWFEAATKRINQLKKIENRLVKDIVDQVKGISSSAGEKFYTTLVIVLALAIFVIAFIVILLNQVGSQLHSIIDVMTQVSKNKDLTVRATVVAKDDLGDLAESLNSMLEIFSAGKSVV